MFGKHAFKRNPSYLPHILKILRNTIVWLQFLCPLCSAGRADCDTGLVAAVLIPLGFLLGIQLILNHISQSLS